MRFPKTFTTMAMIALGCVVAAPVAARPKTVMIVVDDIPGTETCGLSTGRVEELMVELMEEEGVSLRDRNPDFIASADVNLVAIPDETGAWSKTCGFRIDIELQLHHEMRLEGVGKFKVISKLCEGGFTGFMSDGNLLFFMQSFRQSFDHCFERLPPVVARAL